MTRDLNRFLDEYYVAPQFMERNAELERWLIRRSKVEMILLAQLAADNLDAWDGKLTKTTANLGAWNDKTTGPKEQPVYESAQFQLKTPYACPDLGSRKYDHDRRFFVCDKSRDICHFEETVESMRCKVQVPCRWASPFPYSPRGRFAGVHLETEYRRKEYASSDSYDHAIEVDGDFHKPRYSDLLEQAYQLFEKVLAKETINDPDGRDTKTCLRKEDCLARARKNFSDRFLAMDSLDPGLCFNAPLTEVFALLQNSETPSEEDAVKELANRFKVSIDPHDRQGWTNKCRGWEQHPDIKPFEDDISNDQQGGKILKVG